MDSAEFKTLRESLGVTSDWVAEQCEVNPRTARRWESEYTPPLDAIELLTWWRDRVSDQIATALDGIEAYANAYGEPQVVELVRYRSHESEQRAGLEWPPGMHDVLLGHLMLILDLEDYDYQVTWAAEES